MKPINIRLDEDTEAMLDMLCELNNLTRSSVIRMLIKKAVDNENLSTPEKDY